MTSTRACYDIPAPQLTRFRAAIAALPPRPRYIGDPQHPEYRRWVAAVEEIAKGLWQEAYTTGAAYGLSIQPGPLTVPVQQVPDGSVAPDRKGEDRML